MSDPADSVRHHEGYEQYRQTAARTPLKKFPWGTLVGNALGIAGAHAAGYVAGGALANALANAPSIGGRFARLNPGMQRQILQQGVAAAAAIGAGSAGLAHLAGQVRVAEELSRIESEEQKAREQGNHKVANVLEDYRHVLKGMYL